MEVETVEALPPRKMEKTAYEVLEESRTSMEEIVAKMLFIKKEGRPKSELRELVTQMSLHFVNLRQINRSILLEEDRVKAETEHAKPPVDFTTLQLHNLLYEKNHYLKAIKACKDFKSKHPDIELVPEEEFFSSAPEEIKETVMSNDSSHNLMLKRLNFELLQRKELCKLHEKLEQHKKSLLETIANRKKFLSSLPSHLKSLKKASLPVQHQLGVLHTKKLKQRHSAELLPPPLYVMYSQLLAQKEAFEENIDLEIVGSMKDAQAFAHQQANKDAGTSTNTETYRLEDDAPDEDDDSQRRRKRPKKVPGRESLEQSGIYQSHPLKIILHIYDDEVSDSKPPKLISLRFEYLLKLNVVCVGIEGSHEGPEANILCNLFPIDTGIELPHQSAKLIAGDAVTFDEKRTSRPYKWAQHLAGIDFLSEVSPLVTSSETPSSETVKSASVISGLSLYRQQNRVHTVVQRIRSRKKAQMALVEQLDFLMKLKWPPLTYENIPWASHNPLCTLQSWSSVGPSPLHVSSLSAVALEQVAEPLDLDTEGRSGTPREDMENAREDGELPAVVQVPTIITGTKLPDAETPVSKVTDVEHSRRVVLLSKSIVPTFNKTKSLSFRKNGEDSELLLDYDSDLDEAAQFEPGPDSAANIECHKMFSWEDYGVKEFCLVLNREIDKNERTINLEAQVKISMEYPLRPPVFTLGLYSALSGESSYERNDSEWFNELRAIEAEINLHILKLLPCEYVNYILANQVRCLAMLFDFFMDEARPGSHTRKGTSVVDVGLCKPVSGTILSRSFRGRDRRKMVSWKDTECKLGYPC
ncbi:hypothetical protein NE237_018514 [Protea cynaroides]|uniref:THO complex subunit 5 n=1 Tax=Protea cynaroides TaxID=273540 RepID=A0A9Q0KA46_9MAGN|nr:hypothetical protein NE237_018514 [Protea cynaroides]